MIYVKICPIFQRNHSIEEFVMSENKHIEGESYDEKLSQFVGRRLFYLFQCT